MSKFSFSESNILLTCILPSLVFKFCAFWLTWVFNIWLASVNTWTLDYEKQAGKKNLRVNKWSQIHIEISIKGFFIILTFITPTYSSKFFLDSSSVFLSKSFMSSSLCAFVPWVLYNSARSSLRFDICSSSWAVRCWFSGLLREEWQ